MENEGASITKKCSREVHSFITRGRKKAAISQIYFLVLMFKRFVQNEIFSF